MRERSSGSEVIALRRAMRLVRARREVSGEDYDTANSAVLEELDALDATAQAAAISDLIDALVRIASVLALQAASPGIKEPRDVLDIAERGLIDSSLDIGLENEDEI
jgi:hypothetical protein